MVLQFLRNHKDNGVPSFVNSLVAKGEPWRLIYYDVVSVWVGRNLFVDGSKVLTYHLLMSDDSIVDVDASLWILTDVKEEFR